MYAVANEEGKPEDRGESAYIAVSDFIEGIAILARDDVNYVERLTYFLLRYKITIVILFVERSNNACENSIR